jgi:hypothetical protein
MGFKLAAINYVVMWLRGLWYRVSQIYAKNKKQWFVSVYKQILKL